MGRPTLLTPEVEAKIVAATSRGLRRVQAAQVARIHPATLFEWIKRGRAGESPYAEFVERLKGAESDGEDALLDLLHAHAAVTWQAGAWLLERRHPERYALKHRVSHEVTFTEEQARAKYRELTGKDWGE
jgi:hypothetical protein